MAGSSSIPTAAALLWAAVVTLSPLLLSPPPQAQACSLPPGGCIATNCGRLVNLKPPKFGSGNSQPPVIGRYGGGFNYYWNTTGNSGAGWESVRGGPFVNWEVFPNVEAQYVIISAESLMVTTLAGCCSLCARTANCTLFQFFTDKNISKIPALMSTTIPPFVAPGGAYTSAQQCYLLTGGSIQGERDGPFGAPFSGTKTLQTKINFKIAPSWVGGSCNPNSSVENDPHFTGAYGTKFEFNGESGGVFNLISDKDVHINIKLGGYLDSRTFGASVLKDGKAVRTWIKDIGLIWKEGTEQHSLSLSARLGKDSTRGAGYISSMSVDGEEMFLPYTEGAELRKGSLTLQYSGVEQRGPYELDIFKLKIGETLALLLKLRPAHPFLQTPDDAFVHFNLHVEKLTPSSEIHGILGQTFRSSGSQYFKALEYQMLAKLMGSPIAVDGPSGEGFLEGSPRDYQMESLTSTAGKFSSFV